VTSDTTTYVYDARGSLRSVTLPDTTLIEYVIDGQGRRVGKKVDAALVQGCLY
jgi:YD repeat-containing protein